MSVLVIYKSASDEARAVEEFLHDFKKVTAEDLKTVNPETPEGADICRLYDIVEYPSVIAINDSGELLSFWRGVPLPTIDEVSYYV